MTQDLYPMRQVDVELSDGDNNIQKESAGDDAEDKGGSSTKLIAPSLMRSSVASQSHHSAAS
jgi:hypothetical protein